MTKTVQTSAGYARRTLAPAIFSVLLVAAPAAVAQEDGFEPIPSDVSALLQAQFDMVPAPSISERIPHTTCRKDIAEEPFPGVGGADLVGAYYCMIDYGCDQVGGAPVWFDVNGALWFGPDSAERLVAMYCADSISDPERRRVLAEEVQQGG